MPETFYRLEGELPDPPVVRAAGQFDQEGVVSDPAAARELAASLRARGFVVTVFRVTEEVIDPEAGQ